MDQRLKYDITAQDRSGPAFRSFRSQVTRTSTVVKSFAKGVVGGILGGSIIAGLVLPLRKASQALDEFDKLSKRARQSGLSTDFFQTLQLGAEEANFSQETLNRSILAFNKRLGELRAGTGPLIASLKFVDATLLDQLKTTTTTEGALRVLADRLAETDDASRAAAIASAAFSRAGIEMVEVLKAGSAGFDQTAKKARELGLIIDKDLLARAEDINNEFGVTNRVLGIQFKEVLVKLGPTLVSVSQGFLSIAQAIADIDKNVRDGISGLRSYLGLTEKVRLKESEIGLFIGNKRFKPDTVNSSAKGDFLGIRETFLGKDAGSGDPENQASGNPVRRFREEAETEFKSLTETAVQSASRMENAFITAFDGLDITGNRVLDNLIAKLLSLATSELFGSTSSLLGGASGAAAGGLPLGAISRVFGGGPGFASGGSFMVGGSGGTDSQLVAFRASPDERVDISTPGQRSARGASGGTVVNVINNSGAAATERRSVLPSGKELVEIVIGEPAFRQAIGRQVEQVFGAQPVLTRR